MAVGDADLTDPDRRLNSRNPFDARQLDSPGTPGISLRSHIFCRWNVTFPESSEKPLAPRHLEYRRELVSTYHTSLTLPTPLPFPFSQARTALIARRMCDKSLCAMPEISTVSPRREFVGHSLGELAIFLTGDFERLVTLIGAWDVIGSEGSGGQIFEMV